MEGNFCHIRRKKSCYLNLKSQNYDTDRKVKNKVMKEKHNIKKL